MMTRHRFQTRHAKAEFRRRARFANASATPYHQQQRQRPILALFSRIVTDLLGRPREPQWELQQANPFLQKPVPAVAEDRHGQMEFWRREPL